MSSGIVSKVIGVVLALLVAAPACGDDTESSTPQTSAPQTSAPDGSAAEAAAATADALPPAGATESDGASDGLFPDVIAVKAHRNGDGTYNFDVTLSSPYDSAARYADAWRVSGPDGTVFGVRELAHDHAGEQPFTRSLSSVEVPNDVSTVMVEGRDQVNGWGGTTLEAELPTAN